MDSLKPQRPLLKSFALYAFAPVALSGLLYFKQSAEFKIHSPFSYFLELSVLYISMVCLSGCLFTAFKKLKFDYIFGTVVLAFFTLSFFKDANALGYKMLSGNIHYLNLKSNKLILDKRYNCINCKYEVQKGDVVYTTSNIVGIVVAKPHETVSLGQTMGRGIASTDELKLADGQLALLTQGGKATRLIYEKELKGKFLK